MAPDYLRVIEQRHTNKKTGVIQDQGMREVVEKSKKKKEDREREVGLSQLNLEGSSSSNELPREEINEIVLGVSISFYSINIFIKYNN